MKKKGVWLVVILVLRLVMGGLMTGGIKMARQVKVEGKVDKVYQKGSKCIYSMGQFRGEFEGKCKFSQRDEIVMFGKTEQGVTDWFLGRVWLRDEVKVDLVEEEKDVVDGRVEVGQVLVGVREKLGSILLRLLPQKEAGLVAGIVLGEKMRLGEEFYDQLIKTGTVHIVVASGYNVMVVGEMVMEMGVGLMGRTTMVWGAVGVMLAYALMAGGEPPVMRAVIMGMVLLVGKAWGRKSKSLWSLWLAVWLMMMVKPEIVEEVSFQLSVAASLGLMVVEPMMRRWLEAREWGKGVEWLMKTELLPTLAAQITTAPIIWYYFGRVSWIAPVVNVLVLPLVPLVMAWGGLMVVLAAVWLPLGRGLVWWVYGLAHLMVKAIEIW